MDKGILKNVAINFFGLVLPTFVSLVTVRHISSCSVSSATV